MSESADQIRRHIQVLSTFEQKYGEFITAIHNGQIEDKSTWSTKEFAERKREIQMLATRADKAMDASGVGKWALTFPPAIGGGIKSRDLPSQVFEFGEVGFGGGDGLDFQRAILDRIPSQLAGLEMKLEEAEVAPQKGAAPVAPTGAPRRWAWLNHPWTVAVGSGVILLILAAAAAALLH